MIVLWCGRDVSLPIMWETWGQFTQLCLSCSNCSYHMIAQGYEKVIMDYTSRTEQRKHLITAASEDCVNRTLEQLFWAVLIILVYCQFYGSKRFLSVVHIQISSTVTWWSNSALIFHSFSVTVLIFAHKLWGMQARLKEYNSNLFEIYAKGIHHFVFNHSAFYYNTVQPGAQPGFILQ